MKTFAFYAPAMRCMGCAAAIRKSLEALPGIERLGLDPIGKRIVAFYDEALLGQEEILAACERAGFPPELLPPGGKGEKERPVWPKLLLLFLALTCALAVLLLELGCLGQGLSPRQSGFLQLALALPCLLCGQDIIKGGLAAIWHRHPDMNFLVALSALTAFFYSLALLVLGGEQTHFHFCAAAMVLSVVSLGRLLEERAKASAGEAVTLLSELAPQTCTLLEGGIEKSLPTELLQAGDQVLVRPQERFPGDGTVVAGASAVNEALLTGESRPLDKSAGQRVIGGSVNLTGPLTVKIEQVGKETVLAGIVGLVEEARATRPKIQRLADSIAGHFALGVLAAALMTFFAWTLVADCATALPYALSVLVVACPCALGLATPAALVAGLGRAAQKGAIIRDAEILETLARCDMLFLDKTGTLTEEQSNRPRSEAKATLETLAKLGLRCVLLTGDSKAAARAFLEKVPVPECWADCRPQDKLFAIREARADGHCVAMYGDGVNDAPALALADVAISHYEGARSAQKEAGVLLNGNDLPALALAFRLSRRTLSTIRQNLVWAFLFNVIAIPAAAGLLQFLPLPAPPVSRAALSALAMTISSLVVILNALRLKRFD